MYTEGLDQWLKLGKSFANPLSDIHRATAEIYRKAAQQQLQILSQSFSRYSDQLLRLSNIKKPEDLLNVQKECLHENTTAAIEDIQKIAKTTMENFQELTKVFTVIREPFSQAMRQTENNIRKTEREKERE